MRRSTFQWKKGFSVKRGEGNSVNGWFGKDFYRKGNSVKRSGRFSEPPDSENRKVAVLISFPKNSAYIKLGIFLDFGHFVPTNRGYSYSIHIYIYMTP